MREDEAASGFPTYEKPLCSTVVCDGKGNARKQVSEDNGKEACAARLRLFLNCERHDRPEAARVETHEEAEC